MDKILVTGSAGFIGFHLSKSLLDDDYEILGIDNINDYYDPALKQARLDQIKNHPNFQFHKIDICDRTALSTLFNLKLACPVGSFQPNITNDTKC